MTDDVVGGELRGEPVPGVRQPGTDRHDDARRPRGAAQRERCQRQHAEHGERDQQRRTGGMLGGTRRGGQGQKRRPHGDGGDGQRIDRADALVQQPCGEAEQEDEARPQQGLHERQRGVGERQRLQRPTGQPEPGSHEPARLGDEPAEERQPQRLFGRGHARFRRLHRDPGRVQGRGATRGGDTDDRV
jgi:hypothetical protein